MTVVEKSNKFLYEKKDVIEFYSSQLRSLLSCEDDEFLESRKYQGFLEEEERGREMRRIIMTSEERLQILKRSLEEKLFQIKVYIFYFFYYVEFLELIYKKVINIF